MHFRWNVLLSSFHVIDPRKEELDDEDAGRNSKRKVETEREKSRNRKKEKEKVRV